MPTQAQPLTSLVRTVILAGVTALLITSAALPLPAQDSVPATAVEAAKTPKFASKLAHPAGRPALPLKPAPAQQVSRRAPGQGGYIYDNGPINGNTDAWAINFGFAVSNTFSVGAGDQTMVTGMSFGAWLLPGDTLTSAELSITSSPNGGTSYFDQTVNFNQANCIGNEFGFNVCTVSTSFRGPMLNGGTYWVNLQNASVSDGDPAYWDENSGDGCQSSGCPSQAYENTVGTIPSEAFTLEGTGTQGPPTCYQSQGNLQTIFSFTEQQNDGNDSSGVIIDQAGNLYGTNAIGGNNSAGFAYKLTHHGGWLLDPLFNFFGGNNGGQPTGVIIGANGTLYGGAQGGIENCNSGGSQYCGLVFNLTPPPTACLTALCGWNETVPYRFSSENDGAGVINVSASDSQGNLYGTTTAGGAHDAGTVFELIPSGGSWTKTILYTFAGGFDSGVPTQVLLDADGHLYGVTNGVSDRVPVVFQLTPSGGQWTKSVLHTFRPGEGGDPSFLVQDSAGNLYGIADSFLFQLDKSSGWAFSEYSPDHDCMPQLLPYSGLVNLAIDGSGNLYGTGYGGEEAADRMGTKDPGEQGCSYSFIFKASHDNSGWHYQDLYFHDNVDFGTKGSLALDPSGNLYGTTYDCGTNNAGTVWQVSP